MLKAAWIYPLRGSESKGKFAATEVNETLAFRRRVRLRTNAVVGEGGTPEA